VIRHLQQVYAVERAQVGELETLADECGVAAIATALRDHAEATTRHGNRIEARLHELDSGGSLRLLMQTFAGGMAKGVIDRIRPADQLAILRDAISAEAGEVVSYLLLEQEAIHAGDDSTAVLAAELRAEEEACRDLLMTFWNQAVDHVIADRVDDGVGTETHVARMLLIDHLRDVHALERNATMMLSTVLGTVRDELATARVDDHRATTQRHCDEVARRLHELHAGPSLRKQAQGIAFAAVKGPFNFVRTERAAKDLRDMYVVEHFELVAYAQLAALADRCGDDRTLQLAESHAIEEQAMVEWLERESAHFLLETLGRSASTV
jgi:ferritin-like metal-binding protein YciE